MSQVFRFDEVTSTNDVAFDSLRPDTGEPIWILARRQTEGRGRLSREWISKAGNLFASLALRDPGEPDHLTELPFVAAIALHGAVQELTGDEAANVRIKWPNDLLCGGGKVAGILIESRDIEAIGRAVVIGFGVNCHHHPDLPEVRSTDLSSFFGRASEPEQVFEALSRHMGTCLALWDRGGNFAEIRRAWLNAATGIGHQIMVRMTGRNLAGVFNDLDSDGRLLLTDASGTVHRISTGDVFVGPVDPMGGK